MREIPKKTTSFGGATVAYFSPTQAEDNPPMKVANVHLSFEEALKLHLSLGQLLGTLNSYNRAFKASKQAGAVLRVYFDIHRVVVAEQTLRPPKTGAQRTSGENPELEREAAEEE